MSNILAIDTALSACSVAIYKHGRLDVCRESSPRSHIRTVLPMVQTLLGRHDLDLDAIDAIGFTLGPGSFTGLRIGLGVVQGLAFGCGIPVIPVSSLQAIALRAVVLHDVGDGEWIMPVIDARMNEVYHGLYRNMAGRVVAVNDDSISRPEALPEILVETAPVSVQEVIGVGNGWDLYLDRIEARPKAVYADVSTDAEQVLALALAQFMEGRAKRIDDVEPLYLRQADNWQKRQRIRDNPGGSD